VGLAHRRRAAARSLERVQDGVASLQRLALFGLGIACLLAGAITLPLPLPTGIILLVVGAALLIMGNDRFRDVFHNQRRRKPWLDHQIGRVEGYLPRALRKALTPGDGE